jgi:NTP pyrophosphatase (non-canonical NTP hydrolase)
MKKDFLKIIEHFGIIKQLKKFNEECYELEEAILDYQTEIAYFDEDAVTLSIKRRIAEEIADCLVLINQFIEYYKIDNNDVAKIMQEKTNRTLDRIESGYYEK